MFYVKEDDMDDMLRKAAENYQVDAQKAYDWDSVRDAIGETASPAFVQPKRKRRFIFWWLLLIPVGWFASNEWSKFKASQKTVAAAQQNSNTTKEKSSVPYEDRQNNNAQVQSKDIPGNKSQVNHQQKPSVSNIPKVEGNDFGSVPANSKPTIVNQDQTAQNNAGMQVKEQPDENVTDNKTGIQTILPRQNAPLPNVLDANDTKKNATPTNAIASSSPKTKEKSNAHYFYAGLMVGPDISFVKFQQARNIGINAGLIAGYKFNRISIETGLIYAAKNYYSSGEYFDKSKIPFFNNAEITSVDGYCHMFEIPLNARYNFLEKKNHAWFASAGFSSYLMHKEYYNYDYVVNDTTHQGGYPYYNASRNWFSILNLSAGYELKTGSKTNFRIEPYYKIPITGVGVGSMPLSSAGINISISRRIP